MIHILMTFDSYDVTEYHNTIHKNEIRVNSTVKVNFKFFIKAFVSSQERERAH